MFDGLGWLPISNSSVVLWHGIKRALFFMELIARGMYFDRSGVSLGGENVSTK